MTRRFKIIIQFIIFHFSSVFDNISILYQPQPSIILQLSKTQGVLYEVIAKWKLPYHQLFQLKNKNKRFVISLYQFTEFYFPHTKPNIFLQIGYECTLLYVYLGYVTIHKRYLISCLLFKIVRFFTISKRLLNTLYNVPKGRPT